MSRFQPLHQCHQCHHLVSIYVCACTRAHVCAHVQGVWAEPVTTGDTGDTKHSKPLTGKIRGPKSGDKTGDNLYWQLPEGLIQLDFARTCLQNCPEAATVVVAGNMKAGSRFQPLTMWARMALVSDSALYHYLETRASFA
jgi:hypothetical protein